MIGACSYRRCKLSSMLHGCTNKSSLMSKSCTQPDWSRSECWLSESKYEINNTEPVMWNVVTTFHTYLLMRFSLEVNKNTYVMDLNLILLKSWLNNKELWFCYQLQHWHNCLKHRKLRPNHRWAITKSPWSLFSMTLIHDIPNLNPITSRQKSILQTIFE